LVALSVASGHGPGVVRSTSAMGFEVPDDVAAAYARERLAVSKPSPEVRRPVGRPRKNVEPVIGKEATDG